MHANDWPQFLGPLGNAVSAEKNLTEKFPEAGPKVQWQLKLEQGFGGAAVSGDEVFVGDRVQQEKDLLLCFDFNTGKEKWRFENPSEGEPSYPGSRSVPTVEEDAVYFLGTFGEVFRVNRKTGKADWKVKLADRYPDAKTPNWGYAQCTLVVGDLIIVTPFGDQTGVAAWDKKTGREVWKTGPVGNTHSSPVVLKLGGGQQVALLTTEGFFAWDPKTGEELWKSDLYKNRIPIPVPVQINDKQVFVSGGYDNGSKMLTIKKSGAKWSVTEDWSTPKGSQIHSPILIDDHLYFLANENSNHNSKTRRRTGGLVCFNLKGEELWNTGDEPFMGRGASLFADGKLFIQDGESGILRIVKPSPKEFTVLAEANVFGADLRRRDDLRYWSPLALSQGRLLMRGQESLMSVDLRK